MSESAVISIVTAIPATIAAIAAVLNTCKTKVIEAKVDVIHALSNDNLSKATLALAAANETIKGLEAQLRAAIQYLPAPPTKYKSRSSPNDTN